MSASFFDSLTVPPGCYPASAPGWVSQSTKPLTQSLTDSTLMIEQSQLCRLSELLKALAEPARLRVVFLLHQQGSMSHRQLYERLDQEPAMMLYNLNRLRAAGIVLRQKQAGRVHYALVAPGLIDHLPFHRLTVVGLPVEDAQSSQPSI